MTFLGAVKLVAGVIQISGQVLANGGAGGGTDGNGYDGGCGGQVFLFFSRHVTRVCISSRHVTRVCSYVVTSHVCVRMLSRHTCVFVCRHVTRVLSSLTRLGGGSGGTIWLESTAKPIIAGSLQATGGAGGVPIVGNSCGVSAPGGLSVLLTARAPLTCDRQRRARPHLDQGLCTASE